MQYILLGFVPGVIVGWLLKGRLLVHARNCAGEVIDEEKANLTRLEE